MIRPLGVHSDSPSSRQNAATADDADARSLSSLRIISPRRWMGALSRWPLIGAVLRWWQLRRLARARADYLGRVQVPRSHPQVREFSARMRAKRRAERAIERTRTPHHF